MAVRTCGTCRYFERSPIRNRGWCRNTVLYSPAQSHLVGANELDCERGMGNYWQQSSDLAELGSVHKGSDAPMILYTDRQATMRRSSSGSPVFPVTGSSGYGGDPPPPGPSNSGGPPWDNEDRPGTGYYEEERYWTDYVRIVAPILGVLLMVALFWFVIAGWLGDDNNNPDTAGSSDNDALSTITTGPENTIEGNETQSPPAVAPTATTDGNAAAASETAPADATEPPAGNGEIFAGATVEVGNTGGAGVNVRASPSTTAEVLATLLDGTQLEVTGESTDAEDFTWWPVSGEGVEGYIVQDYLVLVTE